MKRKFVCWVICIMAISVLAITMIKTIGPKSDEFIGIKTQIEYEFAKTYLHAIGEAQGMNSIQITKYLAEKDLESDIETMYLLINEYIQLIEKEEVQRNAVYVGPYAEIYDIIALEHAYYISKTGNNEESENWELFEYLILPLNINIRHYRDTLIVLEPELEKRTFRYSNARDISLTDYFGAYQVWTDLEEEVRLYREDINIPDEKKRRVEDYMSKKPLDDMIRKLEEKGINWEFYDPIKGNM